MFKRHTMERIVLCFYNIKEIEIKFTKVNPN